MGDIVRYQSVGTFALLDLAARYREMFLLNFHRLGREASARGRAEPPYAFLLPADQADRGAVLRLVSNLLATGAEVFRAQGAFENDGVTHAAGTFVIPCAQAFSPHVRDLLEPQLYPALKLTRDGDVIRPYDASGWTLPYQFGVSCQAAGTPLPQDLELVPVTLPLPRDSRLTGAREAGLAAAPTANGAFTLANRALAAGLAVQRVREQGPQLGTFIFPAGAQSRLAELGADLALDIGAAADLGPDATVALRKPRVGLLAPWPGSMDAGWTRLVLEEAGFDPLLLTYPEVRSGRLGERIDALVIPDVSARRLKDGAGRELPPAWQGGLGVAGAAAIRQFVEDGGTLLAFGGATAYAIEQFGIPVENPLAALRDKERVVVPGSLLRLVAASGTDGSGVLAGAPREIAAFVDTALVFRGKRAKDAPPDVPEVRSLLVYPPGDPLLSGYLENGQRLTGLPALAEAFVGRGRVLLYGFRPQHRSQTLGTFRLIFNPLFDSAR
jgi:hypothetical protein